MKQINVPETIICVLASQIANLGESIIGAALQEKEGFQWVGNHVKTTAFFVSSIVTLFSLVDLSDLNNSFFFFSGVLE